MIMMAGGSLVGGTYVFASIKPPEEIALPGESTTILFSDGKTEMAKIGDENRTIVPLDKIPVHVQHAVIAVEDRTFYSNEGVDFKGIVRAAWNNVTGGEQQGASTITQQYARKVAELEGGYARKVKEAAIAMKLADQMTKDEILSAYLNTVYFGRGAYGVEAAAKAYFLKDHAADLTVEEGLMLAGFIKNPDAGKGLSPFDPNADPVQAKARWEASRDALVEVKPKLKDHGSDGYQATREMQMPAVPKVDPNNEKLKQQYGLDKPTGHVVHHVMAELNDLQKTDRNLSKIRDLKNGGLRIVTTIDPAAQTAAEKYANRDSKTSPLNDDPQNLVAALVAVEPYTGRVIAYYGGPKGGDLDYAGTYDDPVLKAQSLKGAFHPPASSFKVYTLATALREGISIESYWDATNEAGKALRPGNPVKNANPEGNCANCLLWEATEKSLNIPFYALAKQVSPAKVLETARAAGVRFMRDTDPNNPQIHDLNAARTTDLAPKFFNTEIGFGQYAITPLDHAAGIATIAAKGNATKTHFVREAWKGQDRIYAEQIKPVRIPGYNDQMSADMDWTLQKVARNNSWNLPGGRTVAGKTGTWENGDPKQKGENSHSWTVGYTAAKRDGKNASQNYNGLATAVWVGNKDKDNIPIRDKNNNKISGASGAGPIFKRFMEEASKGKPVGKFAEPRFVGDPEIGSGKSPAPSAPPNEGNPGNGGGSGGPGGGNGGPGGGNGGGGDGGGRGGGIPVPGLPPTPPRD